ncbi:DUF2357 domain-containing protein [Bradyrhizobium diazoefficiens]|uniref:DUF2357 domain-containing protein n=1 Tax=Bradyrhizobium diazoefficiens TaxID=1355477 RepID=A0A809XG67_9BRAD|nr:hypothetical protein XF2B_07410 [Bradyrhizobium diazoefficiens]BCF14050.1 hypothetical protein XF13B_07410 [Bradyrhizobium diazoefficiens]
MVAKLHSAVFAWANGHRLEIEWARGRGRPLDVLPALANLVSAEEELDEGSSLGVPAMCWRQEAPALFDKFQLCENEEYYVDVTLTASREAAQAAYALHQGWPFGPRLANTFTADPPRRWRQHDNGLITVPGKLSLRDQAGLLDLTFGGNTPFRAEVVCKKLSYMEEFRALLNAVAEELAELLLQYDSPTSSLFDASDIRIESNAALMFLMRYIMADSNLPTALDEIRRSFHKVLKAERKQEALSSADGSELSDAFSDLPSSHFTRGGPLAGLFRGYTPSDFTTSDYSEDTDTRENQYIRQFLEELRLISEQLVTLLQKDGRTASAREARTWAVSLDEELATNTFRQVGPLRHFPSNSQVLQKRRGYRDVLRFDSLLRLGLQLPWKRAEAFADGLIGDIRPVNELYEYWCFFMLRRALASIAVEDISIPGSAFEFTSGKLQVRLAKGRRSRIRFHFRDGPVPIVVHLFYNRVFPRPERTVPGWQGSYTSRFDPDFSLEILVGDDPAQRVRHWLHFDAKYRARIMKSGKVAPLVEQAEEAVDLDYFEELARLHKQDDLFKMHTYRDGILGSRGAYILYPGDAAGVRLSGAKRNFFVRHPSAFGGTPPLLFPSVGAFEFCPGHEQAQVPALASFLRTVLMSASTGSPYVEEAGLF